MLVVRDRCRTYSVQPEDQQRIAAGSLSVGTKLELGACLAPQVDGGDLACRSSGLLKTAIRLVCPDFTLDLPSMRTRCRI